MGGVSLQLEEDRISFEEQVLFKQQHQAAWELDVQEKVRLEKMLAFKEQFANQIMTRRAEEFAALKVAHSSIAYCYRIDFLKSFCILPE